ncbi:Phosphotransferase enzyme family protein [Nocardia amikacinitolerans]|uniref:Phosphotransferase enzyme family protein n=1 Tax=Nocardia amikacinitolerans TaxID=756689 RepID=A0A285LLY2_9NOCA|nr:Phosphotransferase enzyme family protein [Nocardia amikacinitolerans]
MSGPTRTPEEAVRAACALVGISTTGLTPIKVAENATYRLPSEQIVVRVAKPGQQAAAQRELQVAMWLEASGLPAVRPAHTTSDLVMVGDRPVTFWQELPAHRGGTEREIALALRKLHSLPPPPFLTEVAPFVRLAERIDAAHTLPARDRQWMREHLEDLRSGWEELPKGLPWGPIHGDAWEGNVVTTVEELTLFIDLERASVGPPEWDLTSTAIKHSSFGWITAERYAAFCDAYGHDVTTWSGFALLRDIREMRMTCMAVQVAGTRPDHARQAQHRVDCLLGRFGSRPWPGWESIA